MKDNYNDIKEFDTSQSKGLLKKLYKVYARINAETLNLIHDSLISNGISPIKIVESEGKFLIAFTLDHEPEKSILTYPKSRWIVDVYMETELCDGTGSGDFRFERAIFYNYTDKRLPVSQTFNDFDSLLKLYPVHYGTIRIKELNSELERWKEKIDKMESKIQNQEVTEASLSGKQQWETYLALLKNKANVNLAEIKFIKELWETLNNKFYGYKDKELFLRYRGIDPLAPLSF